MGNLLPPPSTNVPIVQEQGKPLIRLDLTPVWRQWFLDLWDMTNRSGGITGSSDLLDAHIEDTDPHPDLIDDLPAVTSLSSTNRILTSQSGVHKRATLQQLKDYIFGDDWDNLRFPMSGVDPSELASPATRVTSLTGYTGALSFSGSAENVCAGIAEMSYEWKQGTAIIPHIRWTKPTGSSSAVTWELYYRIIGNTEDTPASWTGPVAPSATIGDPATSDEQLLTYWSAVTMTGYLEAAIVYWRIHRRGDTDADNNAVICHEFDIYYQKNKAGVDSGSPS